ncbi:lytic murein transglycosylase B [Limnohabitans sp. T6-20]|uniref:lytic murein transglycosylase B n=1 Tax=Limnohabitans sp. T6-20 TaxID=1100725 RepID=UPI001E60CB65|nr:lytic murein transglycosylase B [Limnohabitans sp. T6-20]
MNFPSHSLRGLATGHLITLCASLIGLCLCLTSPNAAHAQAPHTKHAAQHHKKSKKKLPHSAQASGKPSDRKMAAVSGTPLTDNPEVLVWTQDAATRLQLDPNWVQKTMNQAQRLAVVEKLVLPPASPVAKDWGAYRARFIEPVRIQAGLRFWLKHKPALERAEREYGVPASIVVGIIGVETLYGQNTGNFRVVDALGTLAFHFPQAHPRAAERQAFFRSELEHFLQLTSRSGADPLSVRGSYAGALGLPQFMPSSWAKFAVDFDGDGRIDLFGSPQDAIGSVANYFKAFQWRTGMPTHYPVTLTSGQTDMDSLMAPDILPTFSVGSFVGKGAALEGSALTHPGPLALIELRNGSNPPSYVAGTENFYAITRYNWSSYYAMAVIELAEAVAREMQSRP